MRIIGLDHVQVAIPLDGEAAARAFYGALLGLREAPKPAELADRGGCWFAADDTFLHLGVEQAFVPARKAHPAFRVADLEIARQVLESAGVTVTLDTSLSHVRRLYVADPFGNRIELIQHGDHFLPEGSPARSNSL